MAIIRAHTHLQERNAKILELVRAGTMTRREVAARLGVTIGIVAGVVNRAGLNRPENSPIGSGDARLWTPDDLARLVSMRLIGNRWEGIAVALGRSVKAVREKARHVPELAEYRKERALRPPTPRPKRAPRAPRPESPAVKAPPRKALPPPRTKPPRRRSRYEGNTCQYIEGEPSRNDACKCLADTVPGYPYCALHLAICNPGDQTILEQRLARDVEGLTRGAGSEGRLAPTGSP